jgi:hypothetical protein
MSARGVWAGLLGLAAWAGSAAATGTAIYDNTGNPANVYYVAQGGNEAIDDLHLGSRATLESVTFEYYDPAVGGGFSATVNLYANPGGLDLGTVPLAGPFVVGELPRGRRAITITLPHALQVDASVWMGVRFSSTTAGLIINNVPAVGMSHDLYLENGGFYWFGGDPRANFGLRLTGTLNPLAVAGERAPGVMLAPPQPNPFRDEVAIAFTTGRRGAVRLDVLDVAGRRVRSLLNEVTDPGHHTLSWSRRDDAGRAVRAGVYLVRLESAGTVALRRVVVTP